MTVAPDPARTARILVTAACGSYLTNVVFGGLVATDVIDNSRIRWVHHALFITTGSLTVPALLAQIVERRRRGLALLPAVTVLAVLPYAGGRTRRHALVASAAAPSYLTALALAWRKR